MTPLELCRIKKKYERKIMSYIYLCLNFSQCYGSPADQPVDQAAGDAGVASVRVQGGSSGGAVRQQAQQAQEEDEDRKFRCCCACSCLRGVKCANHVRWSVKKSP